MTTTWLECSECNEMFEVSDTIAEAMHHWREESGDPFLCVDCATHIEWGAAIVANSTSSLTAESERSERPDS